MIHFVCVLLGAINCGVQVFNCAILRLCNCARLEVLKERRWHKAGVSPWPWVEPTHSCYPEATHHSPEIHKIRIFNKAMQLIIFCPSYLATHLTLNIHNIDETLIHKHDSQRRAGKRVVFQRADPYECTLQAGSEGTETDAFYSPLTRSPPYAAACSAPHFGQPTFPLQATTCVSHKLIHTLTFWTLMDIMDSSCHHCLGQ